MDPDSTDLDPLGMYTVAELERRSEDELIVNLATGQVQPVDPYQAAGRGLPDGYRWLSDVSKVELAAALRQWRA